MSKTPQHPKHFAAQGTARTPVAPPVYRPQPAPRAAQLKMLPAIQMTPPAALGERAGII